MKFHMEFHLEYAFPIVFTLPGSSLSLALRMKVTSLEVIAGLLSLLSLQGFDLV